LRPSSNWIETIVWAACAGVASASSATVERAQTMAAHLRAVPLTTGTILL
jgi:hypothetical protein